MSSVARFIKQVPLSTTYYNVNSAVLAGTNVYVFVPTAANVVGNYPPGYVVAASTVASVLTALGAVGSVSELVLRDMGKTIFCPAGSATGNSGYFRQVQVLKPSAILASQGFLGGAAGNSFGVLGAIDSPSVTTDYYTLYMAVPMAGALGGVLSGLTPIAGGQM